MTPRILVCFGTRPEVIKLAPVIHDIRDSGRIDVVTVTTAQHREMLDQMLETFAIDPDHDLGLMRSSQSLAELTGRAVIGLGETIAAERPDAVLVQGDTTTAFCGALAAFYAGVPVGHVEAGLRTRNRRDPFPEEANRRLVTPLARWHFCPTPRSAENLLAEGVPSSEIEMTGNTVIDALLKTAAVPLAAGDAALLPPKRAARRIVVTLHRRETQGEGQRALCRALARVARTSDCEIVFPVHMSPAVRASVSAELADCDDVHLIDPLPYRAFVHAMRSADLVVTDSGGVQEEAPSLGIPVLVMRETTERPEGIEAGCVRLSSTCPERLAADIDELLHDGDAYARMSHAANPYGDGYAAQRIVARLEGDLAPALALAA